MEWLPLAMWNVEGGMVAVGNVECGMVGDADVELLNEE